MITIPIQAITIRRSTRSRSTKTRIEAALTMKQRTVAKLAEPTHPRARFSPSDDLLAFLEAL